MSHGDKVVSLPEGFETVAESDNCPHATMQDLERALFGVQFHPEVVHTPQGALMLKKLCLRNLRLLRRLGNGEIRRAYYCQGERDRGR